MAEPPPILHYDDLPSGSRIILQHEAADVVIEVPAEDFGHMMQRMVRLPRFWFILLAIFVAMNQRELYQWFTTWSLASTSRKWPLAFVAVKIIALVGGFLMGLLIASQRRWRIRVSPSYLSITGEGTLSPHQRVWPAEQIRAIRLGYADLIIEVAKPGAKAKVRRILGGRDPAELAYILRVLRQELSLPATD